MITKNGKNLLGSVFDIADSILGKYSNVFPSDKLKKYIPVTDHINQQWSAIPCKESFPANNIYDFVRKEDNQSCGIVVGSGNTTPTENDYKLNNALLYSSIQGYVEKNDRGLDSSNNPYVELLVTVENISQSSITINEIGYYAPVAVGSSSSNNVYTLSILVDRTLLDTAITIPSGGSAEIVYRLTASIN